MDDISKLLQEAKPLYMARKKRNTQIKAVICMLVLAAGISWMMPSQQVVYSDEWLENQISMTEKGSVIEDMGLPVDAYGLLMAG